MARIVKPDGQVLYDELDDLRGNDHHKNVEKAYGPDAMIHREDGSVWRVRHCPMCDCIKSFCPDIPNTVLEGCDGECPCHDGIEST